MTPEPPLRPAEIRVRRASKRLEIDFTNGETFKLAAEYLRVESPSAEVQGHSPAERIWVGGKAEVGIDGVDPIGNYAIRIRFDDRHDTGIYSWAYLLELGRDYEARWARYLSELEVRGLSRQARPARQ